MRKKYYRAGCIIAVASLAAWCYSAAHAQTSLIDAIHRSQPAIVTVTAKSTKIFKSPSTVARIAHGARRLLLLRTVKTAQYDRSGAGVIVDPSGIIVTNAHTIWNADAIAITFRDETTVSGQIVRIAPEYDLALIRITPPYALTTIAIADSGGVRLGDDIIFVGHSPLLKQTLSGGTVIGIGTSAHAHQLGITATALLQTNINVYKGDSGGPILDRQGQLIGLMVAGQVNADHSSFAIPSDIIKRYYQNYRANAEQ